MLARKEEATGGQINVAGILYQMLVSLADGLETTVAEYSHGETPSPVVLHIEPFDGGDTQIVGPQHLVIQVKTRARNRRWTTGAIIKEILPDLYQAVGSRRNDRYQIATDNDSGCDEFRLFLKWFRGRNDPANKQKEQFRLGRGGKKVTGEELLRWIAVTLDPKRVNDERIHKFLGSLEIVKLSRFDVVEAINRHLEPLVERKEDLRHKRKQLIGELVGIGSYGGKIRTSDLLDAAGLDPRRLMLSSLIPKNLQKRLLSSFKSVGYAPEEDVREPPEPPRRPITVLRGESGLGKTWQLCAMAKSMMDEGKLTIFIRASADLEALRVNIAASVWNPIYSNPAPLSSVAERLRPRFKDERDVWLTVFLDDLNDPGLAQRIVEDNWAALGIDIVTCSQPATAEWLRRSNAVPEMIDVPGFNVRELIRYLEAHEVEYAELADDVLDLLFKPVLARLFCVLPHGGTLRAETEYELMNSFWVHAATERASQVKHPFDLDRLQLLAGDMISAPAVYPWPPSAFVRTLSDETVFRLMDRGVVELDGDRRLSMTHDRLLNWLMALHLASQAVDLNSSSAALVQLLKQVENLKTITGVNIGARFAYVLMDLVWLLLGPGRWAAEKVAEFLLAYMRAPDFNAHDQDFFRRMIPTLGVRAVPLLSAMAKEDFSRDRETLWPDWIADGLRRVADVAWNEVRAVAVDLFSRDESDRTEIALRVIAKVGSDDLLEPLFNLAVQRRIALETLPPENRHEARHLHQRAFEAFARSIEISPTWLDEKIAYVTEPREATELLLALIRLDRGAALPIWRNRREHLYRVIPHGARVLPKAVRAFAEFDDLHLLELPSPVDAEFLHGATTFDAIARLDPDRAIEILADDENKDAALDLRGTEGWWMPGLFYRARAKLGSVLRDRVWQSSGLAHAQALAFHYNGAPDFIDADAVDLILDAAETSLSKSRAAPDDLLRELHWPLSTLSSLENLTCIDRLVARKGTHFEHALTDLAISRKPSNSRVVDREEEMMAWILAVIAGDGYDRFVRTQIDSTGTTTAERALGYALWTTSEDIGVRIEQLSIEGVNDGPRSYQLMQALAAHGREVGLAKLIQDNTPLYTNAVSIWQARAGDAAALVELVKVKIASNDIEDRAKAVDLSHFLEADLSISLTLPLIRSAIPGDMVANRLLMLHSFRERYEPALLPKLVPFLNGDDGTGALAAFHLALHGDAEGRTVALEWIREHGHQEIRSRVAEALVALLEHEDSRTGALTLLRRLLDSDPHVTWGKAKTLYALASHGDVSAARELENMAFTGTSNSHWGVANAVRIASRMNVEAAFHAARRLFIQSSQLETATILMDTDPVRAVQELVRAYMGASMRKRLAIARTLRWGASSSVLLPVLSALATSASWIERQMAAEIGGWLPDDQGIDWLSALTSDPVQSVEQAALQAVRQREKASAAQALMASIPSQPKPRQWAYLCKVIDIVDPHLIAHPGDPLDVHPLLTMLPAEFSIEAERLVDRRRQAVDRSEVELERKGE